MPSLREVRGHIRSVTGISQVIHAMEAVSSVTAHRLQERVAHSISYAESAWHLLGLLSTVDDPAVRASGVFDTDAEGDHTCLLLVTSTRGMAAGYDQNVIRVALEHARGLQQGAEFLTIGSVGHSALLHRGLTVAADWSQLNEHLQMEDIAPISAYMLQGFRSGAFQRVAIAYTQYREGAHVKPTVQQVLPVVLDEQVKARQFYFEPDAASLIGSLVPRVLQSTIHLAVLEAFTAENVSRAVAMRAAGTNASDLVEHLRLTYNKTRQQTITAEMNEVSSALALELGS